LTFLCVALFPYFFGVVGRLEYFLYSSVFNVLFADGRVEDNSLKDDEKW